MADAKKLFPFIMKWEGGWSDHPADKGGKTNLGITLSSWKSCGYDKNGDGLIDGEDLKLISYEDVFNFMKKNYWDRWRADEIKNQSIANILVDWVWASGAHGIKIPQRMLNVKADGIVGPVTIKALNNLDRQYLPNFFRALRNERLLFVDNIVKRDPGQAVFLKGWKNRILDLQFEA